MSATADLTAELRKEVLALEDDLRSRVDTVPDFTHRWRSEYDAARSVERTASSWEAWRDERVTLAAVAWVLTTVFVRFCEDNGLVAPVWIAHAGGRGREAVEGHSQFLREQARTNPDVTDREWLLEAVTYLQRLPATAGLVDETSPMWLVTPSGDAATRLLTFWRERAEDGALRRDLTDSDLDTRFLGDLYQDISEDAKKRYALLQTPVFVEEFILDRTLEPALAERPLEGFKAIDPTCGSGHFLLGIFTRILERWHTHAPGMDERERVQKALDTVHGVDLNPFAVAIARFRLTVAALQACGITRLEDAPGFRFNLAAGDSLLHGLDQGELEYDSGIWTEDQVAANFAYATENLADLRRILKNGQYDCVVGNPPYIPVKDKALNALYRKHYNYLKGKYALTVPFMERFFTLAKKEEPAGWTGQITSNSFMKREFGAPLIEKFLPTKDLRFVIDSEGAWIPGHNMDGTPTAILIGVNQPPVSTKVRCVLSKTRRETPADPDGTGPYWSAIVDHLDDPGWDSEWLSVVDLDRDSLRTHPWSLSGGGAVELLAEVEAARARRLDGVSSSIGITSFTLEDEVFIADAPAFCTRAIDPSWLRTMMLGDGVRDWSSDGQPMAIFPYDADLKPVSIETEQAVHEWMWPFRTNLSNNRMFGQQTKLEAGLLWTEYGRMTASKLRTPFSITFAFVATHNHFVLDRGGKVFNRSAPVIKLPEGASEDDHLALLGVLNSSTACFWLKQKSQPKGGAAERPWSRTYEFTGTTLQDYPLPARLPLEQGRTLDALAKELQSSSAAIVVAGAERCTRAILDAAQKSYDWLLARMITEQEELDWEVYRLYGLIDEDLVYAGVSTSLTGDVPPLALGERAFEIVLARKVAAGEEDTAWFARHGSTPITELPAHWPDDYRRLVERRIELIESHPFIRLLEKPEHKRRWASESWEKQEERALRGWLLDRLEDVKYWTDSYGRPTPKSVATLADEVARDAEIVEVLALWEGRPGIPVVDSLTKLLAKEAVPYLAAYRYKESGLRKRAAWEHTWDLQRREDAGTYDPAPKEHGGDGPIPVPPKYTTADFRRTEYWAHRGKLDVPKERFILYPDAGRETDPTPVLGWAGWDHAQQALALATLIQQRQDLDGWSDERLVPLVAGLAEVLPWVRQWHDEPSDLYGGVSPAVFFAQQLQERMAQVSATHDTLVTWRPPTPTRGRKKKA